MIEIIAAASVGAIAGSAIMRRIDLRKMADASRNEWDWAIASKEDRGAHTRCADALATKQACIDRALACETPKAAHGVRKMAAILRGDL